MKHKNYQGEWTYKNFKKIKVGCYGENAKNVKKHGKPCGCGGELWNPDLGTEMPEYLRVALEKLQKLRDLWEKPIILDSAHRCAVHNKRSGGGTQSQHLTIAFDCRCPKEQQQDFVALARKIGFTGVGYYPSFIHLDLGRKRAWGKKS